MFNNFSHDAADRGAGHDTEAYHAATNAAANSIPDETATMRFAQRRTPSSAGPDYHGPPFSTSTERLGWSGIEDPILAVQEGFSDPNGLSILGVGAAPVSISAPVEVVPVEMPFLAQLCALALQHRCDANQNRGEGIRTCFHSSRVPGISIWDYVRRFAKYSCCSEECFIFAIILMDRYACKARIPITLPNVHRLYTTAMTLSAKLREDAYFSNSYYASIGGVSNAELNVLELELLDIMHWFTWVERSLYDAYVARLKMLYEHALPTHPVAPPLGSTG